MINFNQHMKNSFFSNYSKYWIIGIKFNKCWLLTQFWSPFKVISRSYDPCFINTSNSNSFVTTGNFFVHLLYLWNHHMQMSLERLSTSSVSLYIYHMYLLNYATHPVNIHQGSLMSNPWIVHFQFISF